MHHSLVANAECPDLTDDTKIPVCQSFNQLSQFTDIQSEHAITYLLRVRELSIRELAFHTIPISCASASRAYVRSFHFLTDGHADCMTHSCSRLCRVTSLTATSAKRRRGERLSWLLFRALVRPLSCPERRRDMGKPCSADCMRRHIVAHS